MRSKQPSMKTWEKSIELTRRLMQIGLSKEAATAGASKAMAEGLLDAYTVDQIINALGTPAAPAPASPQKNDNHIVNILDDDD